jgi:hypothetical protein
LINLSDLFNHGPFIFNHPLKYRIAAENKLLHSFKNHDSEMTVLMTSRSAEGFWEGDPLITYGKVSEFVLTDINELKKPTWHINDWFNNGCKPLGVD